MAAAVLIHAALGTSWEDGGASTQWYFSQDFAGETCSAVCNSFGGLQCNPGVLDSSIPPKYVGYWPTTRSQMEDVVAIAGSTCVTISADSVCDAEETAPMQDGTSCNWCEVPPSEGICVKSATGRARFCPCGPPAGTAFVTLDTRVAPWTGDLDPSPSSWDSQPSSWVGSPSDDSGWETLTGLLNEPATVQRTFTLTTAQAICASMEFQWAIDDELTGVALNGVPLTIPAHSNAPWQSIQTPIVAERGSGLFLPGINTLTLTAVNTGGPTGFLVSGGVTVSCPSPSPPSPPSLPPSPPSPPRGPVVLTAETESVAATCSPSPIAFRVCGENIGQIRLTKKSGSGWDCIRGGREESVWGCSLGSYWSDWINPWITTSATPMDRGASAPEHVVAPDIGALGSTARLRGGWYTLPGFSAGEDSIILPVVGAPASLCGEYYLWNGEAYMQWYCSDNEGDIVATVELLPPSPPSPPPPPPPPSPAPPLVLTYCSSWGDPHLTDFTSMKYDHMGVGVSAPRDRHAAAT